MAHTDPYYAQRFDPLIQAFQTINGRPPTTAELMQLSNNDANSLTQNQVAADQLLANASQGRNTSVSLPGGINSDAEVNQANEYLHQQPFYQQALQWMGQNGSNVHLSSSQQATLMQEIKNAGINVSDHFEIDASGNIHPKSSLGKKILTAAAIGGVALTGLGLAGVGPMAGLLGGAGGTAATGAGVAGAADAAPLASTAIGSGFVPAIAGGTGLGATAAGAGGAAALASIEGGAAGLPADAAAALPGATTGGASTGALASTPIGTGMADLPSGAATSMNGDIGAAATAGAKAGTSTLQKVGDLLNSAGQGIGAAATAAGNNALDQEKLALDANQQNISGQSAYVNELLGLANEEAAQRKSALGDVYRSSYAANPRVSPFDPAGAPVLSDQYRTTATNLGNQGASILANPATYQVSSLPQPTPYTPIDIKNVQGATNTQPGTMQKIGNILSPALTVGSKLVSLFG